MDEGGRLTHRIRVTLLGAVLVAVSSAACDVRLHARTVHSATLTSGSWDGGTWTLTLDNANPNGDWCWTLTGATHPSGACGFNDPRDRTTGPSDSQPLDPGHALEYGPAPVGTTKVVLVSAGLPAQASVTGPDGFTSAAQPAVPPAGPPVTVVPHPLPAWAPPGLWWTAVVKTGVWQPHFYDATGRELAATKY